MAHPKWLFTAICLLVAAAVAVATSGDAPETSAPDEPGIEDIEIGSPRNDGKENDSNHLLNDDQNSYQQSQNPGYSRPANSDDQPNYPSQGSSPDTGHIQSDDPGYSNSSYLSDSNRRYSGTGPYMQNYPFPIANSRGRNDPCGVVHPNCYCADSPYRTFDGTCNNVAYGNRGSAHAPLIRVLRPRYADGVSKVVRKTEFGYLPLPRVVSSAIYTDVNRRDSMNTLVVMEWGQLVSHDASLIKNVRKADGRAIKCCSENGQMLPYNELDPNCLPIEIPSDDPYYSKYNRRCMEMVRSQILQQSGCKHSSPVEQISVVTHFLDASFLYGSSDADNRKLRTFSGGLLKSRSLKGGYNGKYRTFLPTVDHPKKVCDVHSDEEVCYLAGDARVNQNPFLSALHTLFLREHNRLANILYELHPYWSDDTLFQESRRIVIAQWQHITYKYWLPRIIGSRIMYRLGLIPVYEGYSTDYDEYVNPSTMNEFTTGAFRFSHSTIQGNLDLNGEGRCPMQSLRLSDYYFKPGVMEHDGNFDSILRGATTQPEQQGDHFFTSEITKYLFKFSKPFGDDLESFDVQRGRDHGIPSYNDMRVECGFPRAMHFDDLRDVMMEENIYSLKMMYQSVHDVDFFVGGSLEENGVDGDYTATVGPTFGCVIAEQFLRWQRGDRYFYNLRNQAGSFTKHQLNSIRNANFSSLLCENLDYLKYIQYDAFLLLSERNYPLNCNGISRLDLTPWRRYNPTTPNCYEPLTY